MLLAPNPPESELTEFVRVALASFLVSVMAAMAGAQGRPVGAIDGVVSTRPADRPPFEGLEQAITRDPENLRLAADYRQLVIAANAYDRSIRLFETLAKRKGSGPNSKISLALAYVDKVPVTGAIRHLYLGWDAINALTRAIEQEPSTLAYCIRGVINLFYNNLIFHRASQGVNDLQKAMALITADTPPALVERVWVSLGDGYWRAENKVKARETWAAGAARFPSNADLTLRAGADDEAAASIVRRALDENTRVDTTLRNVIREPK